MKLTTYIHAMYIAPSAGEQMRSISHAQISANLGIEGDRYALGTGAYSKTQPAKIRDVSLIALAGIDIANDWLKTRNAQVFHSADTRRNIVLGTITAQELNALIGQEFLLGSVLMLGTELCAPCERPAKLLGKSSFLDAFEGRGGIRAKILQSGSVAIGDQLLTRG